MTFNFAALDGCGHRAAVFVAQNYEQRNVQMLRAVFQASEFCVCSHVAGDAYHEQISESLIEDDLRRHARISATQNLGVWILSSHQLSLAFGIFVRMLVTMGHVMIVTRFQLRQNSIRGYLVFSFVSDGCC